jgi:hypothetical protein
VTWADNDLERGLSEEGRRQQLRLESSVSEILISGEVRLNRPCASLDLCFRKLELHVMPASSRPKRRLLFVPPTSSIPASHLLWNAQDSHGCKYPVDAYSRPEYFWGKSCGFVIPYVPLLRVQLNGQQSCKCEAWLLQFLTTGHRHPRGNLYYFEG